MFFEKPTQLQQAALLNMLHLKKCLESDGLVNVNIIESAPFLFTANEKRRIKFVLNCKNKLKPVYQLYLDEFSERYDAWGNIQQIEYEIGNPISTKHDVIYDTKLQVPKKTIKDWMWITQRMGAIPEFPTMTHLSKMLDKMHMRVKVLEQI